MRMLKMLKKSSIFDIPLPLTPLRERFKFKYAT
jgi:hypothetical protein